MEITRSQISMNHLLFIIGVILFAIGTGQVIAVF